MRVLFIHQYFTTRDGAGSTRSYEFARHLAAKGHSVVMLTGTSQLGHVPEAASGGPVTRTKIDGIDVIAVKVAYSNHMGYLRRAWAFMHFMAVSAWEAVMAEKADIVVASSTPLTVGITGMAASLRHRAPLVFEARDLWPEYIEDFGLVRSKLVLVPMKLLASIIYKRARKIIVISDSMNRRLRSLYPRAEGKTETVPIGSDVDDGYSGERGLSLPDGCRGKFIVAYAGSISYVNDVGRLVEVAERLRDNGVAFVIAGDGRMKPSIDEAIKRKGLDNVFMLGKINKKNVRVLISGSGACAITHRFRDETGRVYINCEDTLTNKFFDYIAAGKPAIINHDSESAMYIEKYNCGIKVPHDDFDEAARMILALKGSPELLKQMGENAYRLACERFDRRKMAALFEGILYDALGIISTQRRKERPLPRFGDEEALKDAGACKPGARVAQGGSDGGDGNQAAASAMHADRAGQPPDSRVDTRKRPKDPQWKKYSRR